MRRQRRAHVDKVAIAMYAVWVLLLVVGLAYALATAH
jgi:hypothetical protein